MCVSPSSPPPGLALDALLREPLAVLAPPGVRVGPPASWGPWVTFPAGSHTRALILDALARLGAPVTIAAESHQPDVLRQMVELGLGWTVLPGVAGPRRGRASHRPSPAATAASKTQPRTPSPPVSSIPSLTIRDHAGGSDLVAP